MRRPFARADRGPASLADMVIAAFDFVSLRRIIGCSRVNLISAAWGMIWPAGCAGTGAMANRYLQRRSVFSVPLVAECDPAGSFLFEFVVDALPAELYSRWRRRTSMDTRDNSNDDNNK
jgi:hypothetical protein